MTAFKPPPWSTVARTHRRGFGRPTTTRSAWLVVAAIAASAIVGCSPPAAASPPTADLQRQADLYAINQIEVRWHQATSTKDLDLMMSLWAEDATFTSQTRTYTGKAEIRAFFAEQAAPFKKENNWVSDTPAYKTKITVDGDKGTIYFQCDYIDIATKQVKAVVGADQQVARINGQWLIKASIAASPGLGY